MTWLNPFYSLILPFLFIFTIPIAIFATITTIIAFNILLFRVLLVYIELALAVVPFYLLGPKTTTKFPQPAVQATTVTHAKRRKRRSSSSSALSAGSITPVPGSTELGLSQSIGAARDFEGVGGWRFGDPSDDDTWTNINSRLDLTGDHVRRHRRSLTGPREGRQNRSYSPESIMNTARARTPPSTMFVGEGYFPQVPSSPRALKRTSSVLTGASGSSGSSKGSSMISMKQR